MLCLNLPSVGIIESKRSPITNPNSKLTSRYQLLNKQTQSSNKASDLILESFYWAVPNGSWYNTISSRMNEIKDLGFTYLWLPPPSKTYGPGSGSNGLQVGYEPYDYYDLGEYNQQGSVNTRYGNKSDLLNLINQADKSNISSMADIVLNQNRGGSPQPNGLDFMKVKSGLFLRNASDFNCGDGPAFNNFPDLCTTNPYVRNQILKWGQWLYDQIGFRGWRFDFAIGYNASTVKAWVDEIGGISMVDYWQPDVFSIMNYLQNVPEQTKALDYPLLYTFLDLFNRNGSMRTLTLSSSSILMNDPNRAVTFVDDHDTVRSNETNIAVHRDFMYAFILLYDGGTPVVFWKDLYPNDPCIDPAGTCSLQNDLHADQLKVNLRKLLEIRKDYAKGSGSVIYSDNDLFIYQRNGNPGLILAMNDNPNTTHTITIKTKYLNTLLYDMMGTGKVLKVDSQGNTIIEIPPLSYLVYTKLDDSPTGLITQEALTTTTGQSTGPSLVDTLAYVGFTFNLLVLVRQLKKKKDS